MKFWGKRKEKIINKVMTVTVLLMLLLLFQFPKQHFGRNLNEPFNFETNQTKSLTSDCLWNFGSTTQGKGPFQSQH